MKSVLISINPKWCALIASGEKMVEVRKTFPKIETPFKCYIYATKSGERIVFKDDRAFEISKDLTGKVIGEFVCRNIDFHSIRDLVVKEDAECALKGTCLGKVDVLKYIGYQSGKNIYAKPYVFYGWHISDLVIYDNPRELSEFEFPRDYICQSYRKRDKWFKGITRPPQSWCYVEAGK